jgi:hypothetical protein
MSFPLGAPLNDGYGLTPQDRSLRTRMDGCNARVRVRVTARPITAVSAGWIITGSELLAFRAWFATDGEDWFSLALAGELGTETVFARITGPWEASPVSAGIWRLNLPLEVQAFTALGEEYIEALSYYNDLIPAAAALHPWTAGLKPSEYYP